MFTIEKRSEAEARTLAHGPNVFHEALRGSDVLYHVDREGAEGYDIRYTRNFDFVEAIMPPAFKYIEVFFDFREYDENNKKFLVLDVFRNYKKVVFLETNEYSIVLGRLILEELKDIDIYYADPRILWFLDPAEHLHVGEGLPADGEDVYFVTAPLGHSYGDSMGNKMSVLTVFQSVFFIQALAGEKDINKIKYVDVVVAALSGIGSIFVQTARIREVLSSTGWSMCNSGEILGKYPRAMLDKYFNIPWLPEDATEENTFVLKQSTSSAIIVTYSGAHAAASPGLGMIREELIREMKEYTEAVFGGKKMLGLLIRGTDYITTGMVETKHHASCEEMFPMIYEWLDRYHYDGIFLATEDEDILSRMRAEFGSKIRIMSQERFRVSDFKSVKLITELEDEMYKGDKDEHVEDLLVNYIYAMYALSRCDGFISSGWCNGVPLVNSFKEGAFEHSYMFEVEREQKAFADQK